MRIVAYFGATLFVSACVYGEAMPSSATVPGSAGSTAGVLLARLAGVHPFSSGSSSPTQRDLLADSTAVQDNTIYYSALDLSTSLDPLDTSVSTNKELGFTQPGDVDVVTGGSTSGIQQTGVTTSGTTTTPSPASATLALLGMAAVMIRRR
jgi:uncharacterized protein (TIGR03382 family)